jgi:hypothetical protein
MSVFDVMALVALAALILWGLRESLRESRAKTVNVGLTGASVCVDVFVKDDQERLVPEKFARYRRLFLLPHVPQIGGAIQVLGYGDGAPYALVTNVITDCLTDPDEVRKNGPPSIHIEGDLRVRAEIFEQVCDALKGWGWREVR